MNEANLQNLGTVAIGLGEVLSQVVFVGGVTVEFYATATSAPQARPTIDVDCITEIHSYGEYGELEEVLRRKGFRNDQSEGAPLCRWTFRGIVIDIMPTSTEALGFSNKWYAEGIRHTEARVLPQGQKVRILESPYFLATKLDAVKNRGLPDLRTSSDFEDIVYMLRNRTSLLNEIQEADQPVKQFICEAFHQLLARHDIDEAIASVLDFGEPEGTSRNIRVLIENISGTRNNQARI